MTISLTWGDILVTALVGLLPLLIQPTLRLAIRAVSSALDFASTFSAGLKRRRIANIKRELDYLDRVEKDPVLLLSRMISLSSRMNSTAIFGSTCFIIAIVVAKATPIHTADAPSGAAYLPLPFMVLGTVFWLLSMLDRVIVRRFVYRDQYRVRLMARLQDLLDHDN